MEWARLYQGDRQPGQEEISAFVSTPHWEALTAYLSDAYGVTPKTEYSCCSMIPGWNVKYRAGGRALCTLYPGEGRFDCMVTAGPEADLLLPLLSPATQETYRRTAELRGVRWLLVAVDCAEAMEDVKRLLALKRKPNF